LHCATPFLKKTKDKFVPRIFTAAVCNSFLGEWKVEL
jgi:hypothetical protein